ncbi:hypothetical protein PFMG_01634 [Plasmodium falciparum IGH-CR14]|uniref:Uncharacterized protein n=1 Tax=Plasmodium falciparum IGH-CR14 TaxID=580059 RepID=A0A0L1I9A0_PLAFA|nr:hypothetical protein PFMG_01634 [Plasmodium falciparum IGH-CR14]
MPLFKVKGEGTNIAYHEQIYTYKNVEKYDEDIIDIDKKFLKIPNKNLEILKRINIYSKYDKNEETNNGLIKKRKRIRNKIYSNNLIDDIKYMDILICGDKNSGKTTFLNCIGCIENNCLGNKCEYYEKDNKKDETKNKYHNNNYNNNKKIDVKKLENNISYNNFNNNEKYSNNIFNIKKKNQQVIWNDNKLELLSYIPIIFSKLINRNYEQFRKSFKKNFLDTDVCEMSLFITRDDLSFINYEFEISNDFCTNHDFNYIKINFCEYGEDFFHKIKKYYQIYYYKKNKYILHEEMEKKKKKKKKKNQNLPLFHSPRIMNMIECALFRIREIKYINFFINLKKSFILVKCTTRLYNIMIKKRYFKTSVLKIGSCRNIKRTINKYIIFIKETYI